MPDATPLLKKIPDALPAAEQLARALDLCSQDSKNMVSDYVAFVPWLAEKLKAERHRVPVDDPMGARQSFLLSTVREFARLGEVAKRATKENPPDFRDFLKFKLFISLFKGDERGEAVINSILDAEKLDDLQLTEGLASATPATLCERGGRLYQADRSDIIWQASDIHEFCGVASVELQAALLLALWTGQRQGDLLKLSWRNYNGSYIRLRQTKAKGGKGRRVIIPVGGPLKLALDAALKQKRSAVTILTNSRGLPWTEDGFRTSWGKAFDKTNLGDLHFHDLRGTAVTRLALSGCTVPEIASITGHAMETVQAILDAHYLGGRVELAESAIKKLNAVYG
jgi:hypothetical protein